LDLECGHFVFQFNVFALFREGEEGDRRGEEGRECTLAEMEVVCGGRASLTSETSDDCVGATFCCVNGNVDADEDSDNEDDADADGTGTNDVEASIGGEAVTDDGGAVGICSGG
jgi:hypothetical protein